MKQVAMDDLSNERLDKPDQALNPIALTGLLLIIAGVTVCVATSFFWELPGGTGTRQIALSFFNGMFLSLPILLSLWMVLGPQIWIIRLPLASGSLLALLGIYLATISIQSSNAPGEVYWIMSAIALAVVVSIQIPLWIVRFFKRVHISRRGSGSSAGSQFSIKHLLIATTVFALVLPLLQWFTTLGSARQMPGVMFREMLGFCGIFILVLAFLTLLSVLIVFAPKLRFWSLALLIIGIILLPFAVVPSISYVIGSRFTVGDYFDMGLNVITFSAANALTMIVSMYLYYSIGFRLESSRAS